MTDQHEADHVAIGRAIATNSSAREMLLVHLGREHDLPVQNVSTKGLAYHIVMHDALHNRTIFLQIEKAMVNERLREKLRRWRK